MSMMVATKRDDTASGNRDDKLCICDISPLLLYYRVAVMALAPLDRRTRRLNRMREVADGE